MTTRCRNRSLWQLHAHRAVQTAIKNIQNIVVLIDPLENSVFGASAQELLSSLGLVLLGERGIGFNDPNRGDQVAGRRGSSGILFNDGIGGQGAVRTLPVDSVGHGIWRSREAVDVPGSGTSLADEGFVLGWLRFADHTDAIAVAWEIAIESHRRKYCKVK